MHAIDSEFSGVGSGWLNVAIKLRERGLITWQYLYDIAVYWGFGKLINNTDMHLGNISFSIDGSGFSPAPVYDMCAMGFSPKNSGEIPPLAFSLPDIDGPLHFIKDRIPMIKNMAREFWRNLEKSDFISGSLKLFLQKGNPLDNL